MENKTDFIVITKRSDFNTLRNFGKKAVGTNWVFINYGWIEGDPQQATVSSPLRFGWTVSSKVGGAVVRNRLKRWTRSYFRNWCKVTKVADRELDEGELPRNRFFAANVVFKPVGEQFYRNLEKQEFDKGISKAWKYVEQKCNF